LHRIGFPSKPHYRSPSRYLLRYLIRCLHDTKEKAGRMATRLADRGISWGDSREWGLRGISVSVRQAARKQSPTLSPIAHVCSKKRG
jgi:hypothetical protein